MKRDLRFEAFYQVPPEDVWRALTDSAALSQWFMRNDFAPRIGHEFRFLDTPRGGWDGVVRCKVLDLEPGRRLSYSWKSDALDTTVTWFLQPQGTGTKVVLEHAGFRGLKGFMIGTMLKRGWRRTLLGKKLPAFLGIREMSVK